MLKEGIAATLIVWTTTTTHLAQPPMRWLYNWKVLQVLDGDTVKVEAKWWPSPLPPTALIRIAGVDTAERGGKAKCEKERALAEEATHFTERAIHYARDVSIEVKGHDKYGGRLLGDVWVDGKSLSEMLIKEKLGQYYYGEKKPDWCK